MKRYACIVDEDVGSSVGLDKILRNGSQLVSNSKVGDYGVGLPAGTLDLISELIKRRLMSCQKGNHYPPLG